MSADEPSSCPDVETLFSFLDGEMDPEDQVALLRHLSKCEYCRQAVVDMKSLLVGLSDAMPHRELDEDPEEWPSSEEIDAVEERLVDRLRASGLVGRRPWFDIKAQRRLIGAGVLRGARTAAHLTARGAILAYSGTRALSLKRREEKKPGAARAVLASATPAVAKTVRGAGQAVWWLARRAQWGLAPS